MGFANTGLNLDLDWTRWRRRVWNLKQIAKGCGPGGYQYSNDFLDEAERRIPKQVLSGEIISFSQHFPRAETVINHGGQICYYVDATAQQLTSGRGLDVRLGDDIRQQLLTTEKRNYELAKHVILWSEWAAKSAIDECGVDAGKVSVILPGANVNLPDGYQPKPLPGRPGIDREFTLGFVGKDWKRKGLPLICGVRDELAKRGWRVKVLCAGIMPKEFARREGVEFVGYIDKAAQPDTYPQFLAKCDIGCLFSTREALGLSILEFLRLGVPVAGFAHEGPAETLPENAGFRFRLTDSFETIADRFEEYLRDQEEQARFRRAASEWSKEVTWDRCLQEFSALWNHGSTTQRLRLFTA